MRKRTSYVRERFSEEVLSAIDWTLPVQFIADTLHISFGTAYKMRKERQQQDNKEVVVSVEEPVLCVSPNTTDNTISKLNSHYCCDCGKRLPKKCRYICIECLKKRNEKRISLIKGTEERKITATLGIKLKGEYLTRYQTMRQKKEWRCQ